MERRGEVGRLLASTQLCRVVVPMVTCVHVQVYTMEQRGALDRLLPPAKLRGDAPYGTKGLLAWVRMSPAQFEERYGVLPLLETDEGWRTSPRARQFGLLEDKVQYRGFSKVGPKAWREQA